MDPLLWRFWREVCTRRLEAARILELLGPGRPAVQDELWDFRARRETYRRWFLVARANWLIWTAWERSLPRLEEADGHRLVYTPHATVLNTLLEEVRLQVEKWELESYWRFRMFRSAWQEGDAFFDACHPESPVLVCPRAA